MSGIISSCDHKYEIINQREGDIVCGDCGLVLDKYYIVQSEKLEENQSLTSNEKNFVLEMLERLNVPKSVSSFIFKNISNSKIIKKSESLLSSIIYNTLIELEIPFTIKDITGVTGISAKKIIKEEKKNKDNKNVVIIDCFEILERVCSKLNLSFKDYTLIKEKISKLNSGFNPSTIISAHIYLHCKENNVKISMKEITNVTGITCMSIKRFIKKNACS